MEKPFVVIGAVLAFLAVGLGAFGAHGLADHFAANPGRADTFDTAVQYHMIHALALLITAWAMTRYESRLLKWAGWLFLAGVVIFSGSLYLLVLTDVGILGAITPLGGAAFLAGWALLAVGAWRS